MIFVTVGTHEQAFNRLISEVDKIAQDKDIKEQFYIQTGFSDYIPQNCQWSKFLSFNEMDALIKQSNIVITHGGPASFIAPLEMGKIPIVVPRMEKFNEHINDHQVDFVKLIASRMNNIIPVYDISDLKDTILDYKKIISDKKVSEFSNNKKFNNKLDEIVNKLMKD